MPISFPANPTVDQTYTFNSITWTWNGNYWSKPGGSVSSTPGVAAVYDIAANSVGYFSLPVGTTEQRPNIAGNGMIRFNSNIGTLEQYNRSGWQAIGGDYPIISSVTGEITYATPSNITVSGTNFGTLQGTLRFNFGNVTADSYILPSTTTSILVPVPAAAYNATVGTVGNIIWIKTTGESSNSYAITVQAPPLSVQYLVVAGGGSGGGSTGGGGGAGGFRTNVPASVSGGGAGAESEFIASTSVGYTVTVGAGAAQASQQSAGITGSNSVFATVTSLGGGGGGWTTPGGGGGGGKTGGSGGGASSYGGGGGSAGPGTSGQGYAGGAIGTGNGMGGGGGAGGPGTASTPSRAGDGGPGANTSITGTTVTYGGGGGGGQTGLGGLGGGGNGNNANGGAATVNTGGGGAGGWDYAGGSGGAGGSGIVILKFPSYYSLTVGVGLTFSNLTNLGFKIFTFTAGTGTVTFS